MTEVNKTEALRRSVLGTELTPEEIRVLAERMGVVSLADGEFLVAEGEHRRSLFLLAEGHLDVGKAPHGHEGGAYRMRPGECAGTRAFVDGSPRKAQLRAVGETAVLTLEPVDFESLLDSNPRLVYKVMRAIFRITHSNLMRMNLESAELRKYLTRTGGRY
jgi:CRP/FNR family transcriptional regulator, cyclic AMP receptor protein